MKKLISLLLALVMLTVAVPAFAETYSSTYETTDVTPDGTTVTTTVTTTITTPGDDTDPEELGEVAGDPLTEGNATVDWNEAEENAPEEVVILYTNDFHAGLSDNLGIIGLAKIKAAFEDMGLPVLLADCGDAAQGDTIATLTQGEAIIDMMNAVGYDVATLGNHEFDYGFERMVELTQRAYFPYVCANLVTGSGETVFDPYMIEEIGGHKIAFVGVCTPETISKTRRSTFFDADGNPAYTFSQNDDGTTLYAAVQTSVDAARAEGADTVIVLSHLGVNEAAAPYRSTDLIANTNGIDVVLDGHSHTVIPQQLVENKDGQKIVLSQTGTKFQYVGCLRIANDGTASTMLINSDALAFAEMTGLSVDVSDVQEAYDQLIEEHHAFLETPVGVAEIDLIMQDPADKTKRVVRTRETNLGDLAADAFRYGLNTDVAILNGGGIRKTIPAGEITYNDLFGTFPYNNELFVVTVTGQQILDALEFSVSRYPVEFGGFLHVSGLKFVFDPEIESSVQLDERKYFASVDGARRVHDVTVWDKDANDYVSLDPQKTYTLATFGVIVTDAMDGYTMFENCEYERTGILDYQTILKYITEQLGGKIGEGYTEPFGAGRITVGKAEAEAASDAETQTDAGTSTLPSPSRIFLIAA